MKRSLRRGGAADLNIYTVGLRSGPGAGFLGFGTFPFSYQSDPASDGVLLRYDTVPGGSLSVFNTGKILVHEIGHWVGLYHTFQGGCDAVQGDYVPDTPPEASPASGCPTGRNSCGDGLADP